MPIVLTLANGMQMHSFQNVQLKTATRESIEVISRLVNPCPQTSSGQWPTHLQAKSYDPNSVEDWIGKEAFKDVSLAVNFSRVNLVE